MAKLEIEHYWRWAHSDLLSNSERGLVAEYLVGKATESLGNNRLEWDAWDLTTKNGIRIEVKASGYVQTWSQKRPSVIRFKIDESGGWDASSDTYYAEVTRRADVYVFCIHAERDKEKANSLDTDQWEFIVLPTSKLNQELGSQKTVGLATLKKIGGRTVGYEELQAALHGAAT